jgi:hypothetical protein
VPNTVETLFLVEIGGSTLDVALREMKLAGDAAAVFPFETGWT